MTSWWKAWGTGTTPPPLNSLEKRLALLFDFQRFAQNRRLAALIAGAEARFSALLTDDDLEQVSAAGQPDERNLKGERPDDDGV